MKSHLRIRLFVATTMLGLSGAALQAQQPSGQWDFNAGNLTATVGQPLTYVDGPGGATDLGDAFGTTTALGIPDIGGAPAQVMRFPAGTNSSMGYNMPTPAAANGGGSFVNDWTIIMDLLFTGSSHGTWRGLMDTDAGVISADAEFFINPGNQLGIGAYFGAINSNTWHRVGIVVQASASRIDFYIDGVQVGFRNAADGATAALDGRWTLAVAGVAALFNDDDGEAASGYVNSIQLRDTALTKPQMAALAGPTAAGIPTTLPPIPSFVERWIPSGQFANRTTAVGAVIDPGNTTIQDSSISLTLNGAPLASPTITRQGGLITVQHQPAAPLSPGVQYTNIVTLTDSLAGQKTFTNKFTAALFFEDFEGVTLTPNKDEGSVSDLAWTHTPPTGWSIDNSQFPATVISVDNPDGDADGYADADGITEWAGWSFARKDWWVSVDDQTRSSFTLGQGNVAVADPDEWDDTGHAISLFSSYLKTPPIPLTGISANSAFLAFLSSWRPEGVDDTDANKFPVGPNGEALNNQTAIISVSYNGAAAVQVLKWDSVSTSPTYHPDSQNESILLQLNNPAGATNMVVTFALLEAANDWWWAIDNVVINAGGVIAPSIARQPDSQAVYSGGNVTLSVVAAGSAPLSYQWLFNGANIAGATGTNYTKPNIQSPDAGNYAVIVSNVGGSITSAVARVEVFAGPITQDLVAHLKLDNNLSDSSGRGNNATAVGSPTFVAGKVGVNAVHIPSGVDYVSLGAPADLNFGTSTDFSISFWSKMVSWIDDPSFISNKDWDSGDNQGYVLATAGDGRLQWNYAGPPGARKDYDGPPGSLTNNWHHVVVTFNRDANAITYVDGAQVNATSIGATQNNADTPTGFATNIGQDGAGDYGPAFTDLDMDDIGIWRRILTPQEITSIYAKGQTGQDISTAIGAIAPSITAQPQSVTVSPGANVPLSVSSTGTLPITYQWKRNGTDVPGAVAATLSLNDIQPANAGDYTVVLNNAGGAVTSSVARVDVFAGAIAQDLVVHLKFDNNLTDSSGRANNGTGVGAPTFAPGKVGANAVHIPSGADYVTLGAPADLNFGTTTDFSVAFWARVVAFSGDPSFIANKDWDSGNNPGWVIATDSDGRLQWNTAGQPGGANGDRKDFDSPGGVFTGGNWRHVVLTYDRSGNAVTYVDGVPLADRSNPPRLFIPVASPPNDVSTPAGKATNIGQDGAGDYGSVFTNADMDDLGVWRRLLTPQEVAAVYAAGQSGNDLSTAVVGPPGLGTLGFSVAGNNLNFTWTSGPTVRLQKATTLSPPNWGDVAGTTGNSSATEVIGTGNAFYRLFRP